MCASGRTLCHLWPRGRTWCVCYFFPRLRLFCIRFCIISSDILYVNKHFCFPSGCTQTELLLLPHENIGCDLCVFFFLYGFVNRHQSSIISCYLFELVCWYVICVEMAHYWGCWLFCDASLSSSFRFANYPYEICFPFFSINVMVERKKESHCAVILLIFIRSNVYLFWSCV